MTYKITARWANGTYTVLERDLDGLREELAVIANRAQHLAPGESVEVKRMSEPAYTHYGYPVHEYNDDGSDPGNCATCHTYHH